DMGVSTNIPTAKNGELKASRKSITLSSKVVYFYFFVSDHCEVLYAMYFAFWTLLFSKIY
ncbi:MAG: hypothetical protein NC185_10785, partial [Ruminococcus sp.]|nr:hypothetical protein [Ruminococcus sp.]